MEGQKQLMQKVVEKTQRELNSWLKDRLREGLLFSKNRVFMEAVQGKNREAAQTMLKRIS